jgi:hypothetical protein
MSIGKIIKKIPCLGRFCARNRANILRCLPKWLVLRLYQQNFDWKEYEKELQNYYNSDESGITTEKRNPKVIVSLTSYPARIPQIHYTLISLLKQTAKPDEIVLWLGDKQFPNKENDLPETVLKLREHGLLIKWTKDIRAYTKLIPSLQEFPDDVIVTADDDVLYLQEWLEQLYVSYQKDKNNIHCHRAHKIRFKENGELLPYKQWDFNVDFRNTEASFTNFLTGVGGVLYPPKIFYKDIADDGLFQKLSPLNDDIWFWAMAVLRGTPIRIVENNIAEPKNKSSFVLRRYNWRNRLGGRECCRRQKRHSTAERAGSISAA